MKLGFIGTGNMAGAIMGGIIRRGIIAPEEIIGSDISEAGRERAGKERRRAQFHRRKSTHFSTSFPAHIFKTLPREVYDCILEQLENIHFEQDHATDIFSLVPIIRVSRKKRHTRLIEKTHWIKGKKSYNRILTIRKISQ